MSVSLATGGMECTSSGAGLATEGFECTGGLMDIIPRVEVATIAEVDKLTASTVTEIDKLSAAIEIEEV